MIISRTTGSRSSAMNMCSVRQRPIPWAPNSRALAASSGVSAFARTFSRRISSAQPRIVSKSSLICGGTSVDLADDHAAGAAVDRDRVALGERLAADRDRRARRGRSSASSQPATHGLPIPRATTAACEVMPPCAVRIPGRLDQAVDVVRRRLPADEDHALARPCRAPRPCRRRARPRRRPRPGTRSGPRAATSTSADGSIIGCSSWSSCAGSIRDDGLLARDQALLDHRRRPPSARRRPCASPSASAAGRAGPPRP